MIVGKQVYRYLILSAKNYIITDTYYRKYEFLPDLKKCRSLCTSKHMAKRLSDDVNLVPKFRKVDAMNEREQLDLNVSDRHVQRGSTIFLDTPRKSPNDRKEYRVIQLANGITALLISDLHKITDEPKDSIDGTETISGSEDYDDEESDSGEEETDMPEADVEGAQRKEGKQEEKMAAAAICIKAGSFSDPPEIPGLAHFLEHMVFMGSEKYPQENDFDAYIKRKGGSDNASTGCEYTTFYFDIQEKYFRQGLDRFAQFFIAPLMKEDAISREIEAVDSEYQMALPSDAFKKEQLLCSLAQVGHPLNRFMWGNAKTLQEDVQQQELYKRLHEFRERHYSSHYMTVAVQACEDLNTLQKWVEECFSDVPNNELPCQTFDHFGNPYCTPCFNRIYKVVPVNDICEVQLTWPLPPMRRLYRSKPKDYVAWLIGHEGKGSLLAYLRKRVWAVGLVADSEGEEFAENATVSMFVVTITLTEEGLANLQQVLDAVFSYIGMLQRVGPQERIYDEIKQSEDNLFRFKEETSASDYVETLCENMHHYPPEDYITGPSLLFTYSPEEISKCLASLTRNTVNIIVLSKTFEKQNICNLVEPWFEVRFCVEDIPEEWVKSWEGKKTEEHFHLPEPNIFLAANFSLLPFDSREEPYPIKIHKDSHGEVWYRRDTKFKLPIAFFNFYIISPVVQACPENAAMLDLFVCILKQQLVEDTYSAQVAQLEYTVFPSDKGIILKVSGFNDKLSLLLETIVNKFKAFSKNIDPSSFKALKDVQSKAYYNSFIKPSSLAKDSRMTVLMKVHWMTIEKHKALHNVTINKLLTFMNRFLRQVYVQCLIQGNVSDKQAVNAFNILKTVFQCDSSVSTSLPEMRVVQVPHGESCLRIQSFNAADSNSVITNYYQFGPVTMRDMCILELILLLMEEPVFDVLRTKEQLGYNVYSVVRDTFGILGFSITVSTQAHKHSAGYVDERIETFLKTFKGILKELSQLEFEDLKKSLIKVKMSVDLHLEEEVNRNWDEVTSLEYIFDRKKKEVDCIRTITLNEAREWFMDQVACGTRNNFRKLSIQVVGNEKAAPGESASESKVHRSKSKGHAGKQSVPEIGSLENGIEHSLQFLNEPINSSNGIVWIENINAFKKHCYIFPDMH